MSHLSKKYNYGEKMLVQLHNQMEALINQDTFHKNLRT